MTDEILQLLAGDLYPNLLKMYTDIFCHCESYARAISEQRDVSYTQMWEAILEIDKKAKEDAIEISDEIVKEVNKWGIFGHDTDDE